MRWGVVGGLRGGEGAGGKMWVVSRGGAVRTADRERRGWGRSRGGGKLSYDLRKRQYWGIVGRVRDRSNKKNMEKGDDKKKKSGSIGLPPVGIPGMARGV